MLSQLTSKSQLVHRQINQVLQQASKFCCQYRRTLNTSSLTSHGDAELNIESLKRRSFVYDDVLSFKPIKLLRYALKTYLAQLDGDHNSRPQWMQIGDQHTFFRPQLSQRELCEDGTDIKFIPGPQDIWKYRLWAGGSVVLHQELPQHIDKRSSATVLERVSDIRVVRDSNKAKRVFVTIERKFGLIPAGFTLSRKTEILRNDKLEGSDGDRLYMTETENICFLRDQPSSLQDERLIKPQADPTFTWTMTPQRGLLFQFSALTYNAHSIHIDREAAQKIYGAKDLVVHGPLTQVLMVQFLQRYLIPLYPQNKFPLIRSITYTNLGPLYVDQMLTLCCRPGSISPGTAVDEVSKWHVWIQKGDGGNVSMAVKATVLVDAVATMESQGTKLEIRGLRKVPFSGD